MPNQNGTAALSASTSLGVTGLKYLIGGATVYYVTETSVNPGQSYTIESRVSDYTTEDGLQSYTTEQVRQRYITEAGVNAVGPFYVQRIGGPPSIFFTASTALTARAAQQFIGTADFAAATTLAAFPSSAASAALSAATVLQATGLQIFAGVATLTASTSLLATAFTPSLINVFRSEAILTAIGLQRYVGSSALSSETALSAFVTEFGEAAFAASTTLFGDGEVVLAPVVQAEALLEAATTLFAYATRVPYPPSIVGHTLVYIVNAPVAAQLTSDPVIMPLIGNSGVTVWHTQTNSVTQLSGAWNVIFKKNMPFDVDLAESRKCVLIYDQTALVHREPSLFVVLKNEITPPLQDLEIVVDGFGTLIMPSTLPSLIGF